MEQVETFKATLDTSAELDLIPAEHFPSAVSALANMLAIQVATGQTEGFNEGNALVFGYDKEVGSLYLGRVSGVKVGA